MSTTALVMMLVYLAVVWGLLAVAAYHLGKTEDDSCRRFRYDPCKRVPFKAKAMNFSQFSDSDFSLD